MTTQQEAIASLRAEAVRQGVAETGPVSVLAVMDMHADMLEAARKPNLAGELREARAAVAELVEATEAVSSVIEFRIDDRRVYAHDRLRAALARVGGVQ